MCEHSFGTCVRIISKAGHCLWNSMGKRGKFCKYSGKETLKDSFSI